MQEGGAQLYAFSNGSHAAVSALLEQAGLADFFREIVSVEAVGNFKPAPAVYRYLLQRTGSAPQATWLVSSNSFDILGAAHAGLRSVWVKRAATAVLDPLGIDADLQVSDLRQLAEQWPG